LLSKLLEIIAVRRAAIAAPRNSVIAGIKFT
jgi:hypothetical protein